METKLGAKIWIICGLSYKTNCFHSLETQESIQVTNKNWTRMLICSGALVLYK